MTGAGLLLESILCFNTNLTNCSNAMKRGWALTRIDSFYFNTNLTNCSNAMKRDWALTRIDSFCFNTNLTNYSNAMTGGVGSYSNRFFVLTRILRIVLMQ